MNLRLIARKAFIAARRDSIQSDAVSAMLQNVILVMYHSRKASDTATARVRAAFASEGARASTAFSASISDIVTPRLDSPAHRDCISSALNVDVLSETPS
jgi:hypothetical protein